MAPAELDHWENVLAMLLASEDQLIIVSSIRSVALGYRHDALKSLPKWHGADQGIKGIKTRE